VNLLPHMDEQLLPLQLKRVLGFIPKDGHQRSFIQ
jgi:hypothetical protein